MVAKDITSVPNIDQISLVIKKHDHDIFQPFYECCKMTFTMINARMKPIFKSNGVLSKTFYINKLVLSAPLLLMVS